MENNAATLGLAISRQKRLVWSAKIQLDSVEQSFDSIGSGTRSVIEAQIARAASGTPRGMTVSQASQRYWDARSKLMELNHRAEQWALAMRQEVIRLKSGIPVSQIPPLYSAELVQMCPELLK
jgi:hypothetical protein